MGWERRKREHECNLPDAWKIQRSAAEIGDIWSCWRCKSRWELKYPGIASTNLIGPGTKPQWVKLGAPEDIWPATGKGRPPRPGVPREPKPRPAIPEPQIPARKRRDVPPKPEPQAADPEPLIPDPPRQTGTDWLYTVREDGKDARGLDWIKTMPTKGPR